MAEVDSPPSTLGDLDELYNHQCIMRIILNLDLKSMLLLAATNHTLQDAVIAAFSNKFRRKIFWLNLNARRKSVIRKNQLIVINGLEYCFPFLRLFGGKISKLVVTGDRIVHIDRYISQYCNNTLAGITFNYRRQFVFDDYLHRFNYVETVQIIDCDLGSQLHCFAQWFPNVRRLKIVNGTRNNRTLRVYFPFLQDLSVSFTSCINLLRANLQLQSIELNIPSERRINFLDIIVFNRSLLKLTIKLGTTVKEMSNNEIGQLIDEHRLLVELNLQQHKFTADDIIRLVSGLNLLKRIRCQLKDHGEYECLSKRLDKEWTCQPIQQNSNVLLIER